MRAVIAQSQAVDTKAAVADLLSQSRQRLAGTKPKGALLFASTDYDHTLLLTAIQAEWPGLPLIGGSSDGEVSSLAGFAHDSVLLTLLVGDDLVVRTGVGRHLAQDVEVAAQQAMATVPPRTKSRSTLCFTVFAPTANSSAVVHRLQELLGADCPILGGLTGDHREYDRMVEFHGGDVLRDSLPVMRIEGDFVVGWGIGTGWFPVGEAQVVTRADGHVVHEIGGQPALDVFRDYQGVVPDDSLGEYPLAVYPDGLGGNHCLRAVLSADPATGSLRLAGEVPTGSVIRMTEVLPEGILAGSAQAATAAVRDYRGIAPELALVFSCAARKWVLGTKAETEWRTLQDAFLKAGVEPTIAGFYAFGEIAPTGRGRPSEFHNESCVAVLVGR